MGKAGMRKKSSGFFRSTISLLAIGWVTLLFLASCQVTDKITDFVNDRFFNQKGREPIADAGPDLTVNVGEQVVLDGSGSRDPNSDPLGWIWAISTKPTGSSATLIGSNDVRPSFTPDKPGKYVITLIVNDGHFNSTEVAITITAVLPGSASAPSANAGPDQNVAVGRTVNLDGSGSSDTNGDTLSFTWTIVGAPSGSTATLSDSTSQFPTFVPNVAGEYTIQLEVSDGIFTSTPDFVMIFANTGPVANAGPDKTATVNQVVILNGSGSSDSDGDTLSFRWTFERRPAGSSAGIDDARTVFASFVPDVPGTYIVRLVVSDGKQSSSEDTAVITVSAISSAQLPVARAGRDGVVSLNALVTLNGTNSSDPDGDPLTFAWTITTLPTGSSAFLNDPASSTPTFTADVSGIYIIELVVSDGTLSSQPDSVVISTSSPVADAGGDQTITLASASAAVLDGSGSFDLQGDPLTYTWSFQAIPATSAATLSGTNATFASFTPDVTGNYVVQLIVSDGVNTSTADVVVITVT